MEAELGREKMNIVIVGHVDHGKSTIIGRLLVDTHSLPEGKLDQVKINCQRNSKPFEYAFLIDALKDEQAQGITIDSARIFFKTRKRHYLIMDAPGHIEFLKNMVTGASRAEAALLVIDAHEGVQENSRRHGYMLSLLGIRQIAVLINKMDLMEYRQQAFEKIREEYIRFLSSLNIQALSYIPVSGFGGDNIVGISSRMNWYRGPTVLEVLDQFGHEKLLLDKPFRMSVQDVYKFTKFGDQRRIVAGTIETGKIRPGDEIIFYPSGKKSRVKRIESFGHDPREESTAGYAVGFTLHEQIYIPRGEMAAKTSEPRPKVTSRFRASLFWLGREPMTKDKEYLLKIGAARVPARLESIHRVIDASDLHLLDREDRIERHDVAECDLKAKWGIAFDLAEEIPATSRFVIVDRYEISGGGIIREALQDEQAWVRDKVLLRDVKWEYSTLSPEQRAEQYQQQSSLVLITGGKDSGKKPIARRLEARLFSESKLVYFLGIGNVLYGVDSDIRGRNNQRQEHLRRLAEVAHILLEAGMILIVTAIELTREDLQLIQATLHSDKIETIWIGEEVTTDIPYDLKIENSRNIDEAANRIRETLREKGILSYPLNHTESTPTQS